MQLIEDWNGDQVPVRRSRGGVLTFENWEDNVLRGAVTPWPPPDLLKKVRGDVAQKTHFHDVDAAALAAQLDGRISKSQSITAKTS